MLCQPERGHFHLNHRAWYLPGMTVAHSFDCGSQGDVRWQEAMVVSQHALLHGAQALAALGRQLPRGFDEVLMALWRCRGQVVLTGVGKSGHVARKAAATLASVGARATFMHATEALHGDLGQLGAHDVVLALSFRGASVEVLSLVEPLRALSVPLLALVGTCDAPLFAQACAACALGAIEEACPMGLVPTTSTTAMQAITDAWALALSALRGQGAKDYRTRHPAGVLGHVVKPVAEVMRRGAQNPIAHKNQPLREVLSIMTATQGRPGAAAIVDDDGRLVGLFTDGDLRRLLLQQAVDVRAPVRLVMHVAPKTVAASDLVARAAALLRAHAIDQVPVVDDAYRPIGWLDIHDVMPQ